jgi:erythromycin esterase
VTLAISIHYSSGSATHGSLFVFPAERDSRWLSGRRGHRAIGVVYDPYKDHRRNWVPTVIGRRYDAFCSFGTTTALGPLHRQPIQVGGERDTYPWNT